MKFRATAGSLASVAFGFLLAALPSFLIGAWLPFALLAAGLILALISAGVWAKERYERGRRRRLAELLLRVAAVGEAVVELRHGPTLAAWCQYAEAILDAAIGPEAAEIFATTDAAGGELDPMAILAGSTFGSQYVANLRDVASRIDAVVLRSDFDPSACSTFDPVAWELAHARPIAWEAQNGAPCPWCGERIFPSNGDCGQCGAQVGAELAFR